MVNNGQQQQNGINIGPGRPDERWGDNKVDQTGPEIDQLNYAHHQNENVMKSLDMLMNIRSRPHHHMQSLCIGKHMSAIAYLFTSALLSPDSGQQTILC